MLGEIVPKSALSVAVAGAGLCFLGYCIYFDHKRRSDPLFKQKLRQKRRNRQKGKAGGSSSNTGPESNSFEDLQKFFLQEVQVGEELLAAGNIDGGIEHLSNAIAICGRPQQLLGVLQSTLPPQVFQLLLQRLPVAGQRMQAAVPSMKITEDDVE